MERSKNKKKKKTSGSRRKVGSVPENGVHRLFWALKSEKKQSSFGTGRVLFHTLWGKGLGRGAVA